MKRVLQWAGLAGSAALVLSSPLGAQRPQREGEWRNYAGDVHQAKYSPLAQITRDNVKDLQVAWRWVTADRTMQLSDPLLRAGRNEETPLMVNGVLYTVTGLGFVAALDPATGTTRWVYDPESYKAGRPNNVGFMQRGLAYWTDGTRERLFVGTADAFLLSIDARTGKPDPAFGDRGKADLTVGIRDAVRATNFTARRPLVAGDVVVVGNSIADSVMDKEAPPGYVHAFDVRTGKLRWTFHTIPRPGEFGHDTWLDNSAEYTGSTNVWSGGAYDPELDYVYLPTSTPTQQLLRRPPAREQPVRREPRLSRGEDRQARVALPGGASRHLGLRLSRAPDPRRDHGRRAAHQGGDAGEQAGVSPTSSIARPASRSGRLKSGRCQKGNVPGEWYAPTQPFPTQAARLRSAGSRRREPHRLARRS